jgi:hypothetical protein
LLLASPAPWTQGVTGDFNCDERFAKETKGFVRFHNKPTVVAFGSLPKFLDSIHKCRDLCRGTLRKFNTMTFFIECTAKTGGFPEHRGIQFWNLRCKKRSFGPLKAKEKPDE